MQISVENLSFSYYKSEREVLNNINLNISKGEFISIIGPNGAGKTTLLKCISGILSDYNGKISIHSKNIKNYKRKSLAKEIAYVPQNQNINFDFTVKEIINMGFYSREKELDTRKILKGLMLETDTFHLRNKSINKISGGERQRVFIARALAQNSSILFLDEPVSNLDIKHQHQIMSFCKKLSKEKKYTIISVLHDINLASIYSDKIAILKSGNLIDFNSKDKLLRKDLLTSVYDFNIDILEHNNNIIILPEIN